MPEREWILNALNAGELSPRVFSRGDIDAYKQGAKQLLNVVPMVSGGVDRRPGTRFVRELNDSRRKARLIEFVFSTTQSYVLELSDHAMRFYHNGGILLQSQATIQSPGDVTNLPELIQSKELIVKDGDGPWRFTATTGTLPGGLSLNTDYFLREVPTHHCTSADVAGSPDRITSVGHRFTDQMGPMIVRATRKNLGLDLSDTYYIRAVIVDEFAISKTLDDPTEEDLTGSTAGSWTVGPTPEVQRTHFGLATTPLALPINIASKGTGKHTFVRTTAVPISINTPWDESEIADIKYAQSGDILYLTHPNHPPHRLIRFSDSSWHLEAVDFIDGPYETENQSATEVSMDLDEIQPGITATATNAIFSGWNVGGPFRYSDDGKKQGWGRITEVNATNWFDTYIATSSFTSIDIDVGNNLIGIPPTEHFATGDPTRFVDVLGTLPAPLKENTTYYVISVNTSTIKLADSRANALADIEIVLTDAGEVATTHTLISAALDFGGAHNFTDLDGPYFLTAHDRLPLGLRLGRGYWVQTFESVPASGIFDQLKFLDAADGNVVGTLDRGSSGLYQIHGGPTAQESCIVEGFEDFHASTSTDIWRIGAWGGSPGPGFPQAVGFSEQRLFFAGSPGNPNVIWGSRSADFQNFAPDDPGVPDSPTSPSDHTITDQSGLTAFLVSGEINIIHWLAELRVLLGGTAGGLWRIQSSTLLEPIAPTNINPHMSASTPSAEVQAVKANEVLLYLCSSKCRMLAASFSAEKDTFVPLDLNILADHLPFPAIDVIAWAPIPWQAVWCARSDGKLISLVYSPDQQVTAWSAHDIGGSWAGDDDNDPTAYGTVESLAVIDSGTEPNGDALHRYSQVWMIVKRTIDGETKRYVEYMRPRFEIRDEIEDAAFLDSHLAPYDGVAKTAFTGLDHLEGETVSVWADGADQPDQVVVNGAITLPTAASKVTIGLRQNTRVATLPLKFAIDRVGTARSAHGRHVEVNIALFQTSGLLIGEDEASLAQIPFRSVDDPMDAPPPLFTGTIHIRPEDYWDREGVILMGQNTAGPLTLLGLDSLVSWEGR